MKANKALVTLIPDVKPRLGQCWENARRAVLKMCNPDMLYVEGYAIGEFLKAHHLPLMEHSWIEFHGEIIEITPPGQRTRTLNISRPSNLPIKKYRRWIFSVKCSRQKKIGGLHLRGWTATMD